jgi:hypothetical protein
MQFACRNPKGGGQGAPDLAQAKVPKPVKDPQNLGRSKNQGIIAFASKHRLHLGSVGGYKIPKSMQARHGSEGGSLDQEHGQRDRTARVWIMATASISWLCLMPARTPECHGPLSFVDMLLSGFGAEPIFQ